MFYPWVPNILLQRTKQISGQFTSFNGWSAADTTISAWRGEF
jgi:hypothetical protein